ncbi:MULTISPECIES: hypothetical protein [unclassified Spirillospora]
MRRDLLGVWNRDRRLPAIDNRLSRPWAVPGFEWLLSAGKARIGREPGRV